MKTFNLKKGGTKAIEGLSIGTWMSFFYFPPCNGGLPYSNYIGCHMLYYHGDKKYSCLVVVGIGLSDLS